MVKARNARPLTGPEYLALGEFRYQLRRFMRHMEEETRKLGANPQQYQLVLAVKGLPQDIVPTISRMAERMQLNHNSMVELVDRCEEHNLLRRTRLGADRRRVTLSIAPAGETLLGKLGVAARQELSEMGPALMDAILRLTNEDRPAKDARLKTKAAKSRTGALKKQAHQ
jgi:DNA-binding MarR family transcriptional regulator